MKWIRLNPGAPREEGSYYRSEEGRFRIEPNFRGRSWPDSYSLFDTHSKESNYGNVRKDTSDSIRELKAVAERRVAEEVARDIH